MNPVADTLAAAVTGTIVFVIGLAWGFLTGVACARGRK